MRGAIPTILAALGTAAGARGAELAITHDLLDTEVAYGQPVRVELVVRTRGGEIAGVRLEAVRTDEWAAVELVERSTDRDGDTRAWVWLARCDAWAAGDLRTPAFTVEAYDAERTLVATDGTPGLDVRVVSALAGTDPALARFDGPRDPQPVAARDNGPVAPWMIGAGAALGLGVTLGALARRARPRIDHSPADRARRLLRAAAPADAADAVALALRSFAAARTGTLPAGAGAVELSGSGDLADAIGREAARQLVETMRACDLARFGPSEADEAMGRELIARALGVIDITEPETEAGAHG